MLRYAVRSLPWARTLVAAAGIAGLVEFVRRWPGTWALFGACIGILAGAAGWSLDEPAARVVDTTPRSLLWRTTARLPAAVLLSLVWVVAVVRARDDLFGHATAMLVAGCAAVLCGLGWTTWRRADGAARPGDRFAAVVIPAATAWALIQPFSHRLPVFPGPWASASQWAVHTAGWGIAGGLAVGALGAALADTRWWVAGRRHRLRSVRAARSPRTAPPSG